MDVAAQPFGFDGDDRGVLCLHGFTGTPYEMRYLGRQLASRGYTVCGPALPGHCTSLEEFAHTSWRDWYRGVEDAFDDLRARCQSVAVVGQSLGGLLALHLAAKRGHQVSAIAALATPLWFRGQVRAAISMYRRVPAMQSLISRVPKGDSDVRDPIARKANPAYREVPATALLQLDEFRALVRTELAQVRVPTLIVHARNDHTAAYAASHAIARGVASADVRQVPLFGSYHLIATDIERDIVAREVGEFFDARTSSVPSPRAARAARASQ